MSAKADVPKRAYPGGRQYIWRIYLSDKAGSTYKLDQPRRWLSHRSIERRQRQGLAIDSTDLPVSARYLNQISNTIDEAEASKRQKRATVIGTSRWNNTVLVKGGDTLLVNALMRLSFIKRVERVWTSPDSIPKGLVKINVQEHFNPWDSVKGDYYANGRQQIEMLNGQRLHALGSKGHNILIAVLDGGFGGADRIPACQHMNIVGQHDFVVPASQNIYYETDHGTRVLSAMATNEPEVLVGTAPEARYWLLRCEDQQTEQPVEEDYWAMAAEFADSAGVDIINSSLGYNEYDAPNKSYKLRDLDGNTTLISRTASLLIKKGIILINSAGNSGMGAWKKICFPADAMDVLTVGAVTREKRNAPFSSVGPTQDGRVKPDVMAQGSHAALISGRGTVVRDMGTSFATPIVCGLTACLWQLLPHLTAAEIITLIRRSSDNSSSPDNIYGYGLPNFWKAYMIGRSNEE